MKAEIDSVCRALVPILGQEVAAKNLEELARVVAVLPKSDEVEYNPLSTGGFRLVKRENRTGLRLILLVEPNQLAIFGDLTRPGVGHSSHGRLMTFCWKEHGATASVDCDFSQEPFYGGDLALSFANIFRAAPELRAPLAVDQSATLVMRAIDAVIPVMAVT